MIFYVGSYTELGAPALKPIGLGLSCYDFNENDGNIKLLHSIKLRNPSYITITEDKKYLFVAEEMKENDKPKVYSFRIEKNGNLTQINAQYLKGDYACHLAVVGNKIVLANYVSGSAISFDISKKGTISENYQVIQLKGKGIDKERQEGSHAHMIFPTSDTSFYLVDLGLDIVKAYFLTGSKQWENKPDYDIHAEQSSGSRHLAMVKSKSCIFLLGELLGVVYVMHKNGVTYTKTQKISCVPKDYNGIIGAAAIRIHPSEKYLYVSCRGSDTITAYKIDEASKKLTLISHTPTGGKTPRDFNIHPSGKWLIVANQDSNNLVTFKIDEQDGSLHKHSDFEVLTPTNIEWLNH